MYKWSDGTWRVGQGPDTDYGWVKSVGTDSCPENIRQWQFFDRETQWKYVTGDITVRCGGESDESRIQPEPPRPTPRIPPGPTGMYQPGGPTTRFPPGPQGPPTRIQPGLPTRTYTIPRFPPGPLGPATTIPPGPTGMYQPAGPTPRFPPGPQGPPTRIQPEPPGPATRIPPGLPTRTYTIPRFPPGPLGPTTTIPPGPTGMYQPAGPTTRSPPGPLGLTQRTSP